ncbi:MAG: helix-turn-helix transcriptional regulator [Firmicutes bacterium]|nr:helix-turn-helix transcriptional regulator [Bacillota bacterium]
MVTKQKEKEIFAATCRAAECCVEKTLNVIGGKWGFLILKNLFSGKKRFGELRRLLHDINAKSLTSALRSLEENGLINREVFPTVPTTVEYSLTQKGEDLKQIIMEMYIWGEKWVR